MSGRAATAWREPNIPSELRALPRWVAWHYVERAGHVTKVPICARTGGAASATDPATWCDYVAVAAYARAHDCGVGYVLGDGITGVDLDHCITDTGELEAWAREIVAELDSYTETSPSGRGVHVLVRGAVPGRRRRTGKIEVYDRDRYFCVSGRHLAGTPQIIEERSDALAGLHRRVFGVEDGTTAARSATLAATLCSSDSEIIERARGARNGEHFRRLWGGDASGYASASEADLALCSMLAWHTDDADQIARLVAQSGLARQKWERPDYRERTVAAALAGVGARRGASSERTLRTEALVARELGL
ncbi:MAG: hypothetical protein ABSA52_00455 [Candidatus Binatia bacterium]|jgi:putative DNA primase/helicase